jgi:hypothetical protein
MWRGHEDHLRLYLNATMDEWERRGFRNVLMRRQPALGPAPPAWWGDERLHASHRSNLLRKDPEWYGRFAWVEPPDLPYFWPV